jgi:exodeoxyribonuclease V gamma subunit
MSLTVISSNRMESLVDSLAATVARPLASPLVPETIVVQSAGMERWLAMELARRFGVWANGDYPFPNAFVWRLFRDLLGNIPDESPFSPDLLTWRLMDLLPPLSGRSGFEPIAAYLANDRGGLKLFQLAEQIADTFDQYTLFRPEMLDAWEAGKGNDWQPLLWRELVAVCGSEHRGRLLDRFRQNLASRGFTGASIPERVSVFGVSYLPPFHLEFLVQLSCHTDIQLFVLSPCREYWADIVSRRQLVKAAAAEQGEPFEGNPLLASLGRLGRDFSDLILSHDQARLITREAYREPAGGSLLQAVQRDILQLRDPAVDEPGRFAAGNAGVQILSCHSPMREVEVLHDHLLALLDSDPTLTPRDILVMTPDIEAYAPYVAAVFDGVQEPARRVPYSVADRSIRCQGHLAEAVMAVFDLAGSRFGVTRVFDLLSLPAVHQRFGIARDDLETIRGWLAETRVRWGIDQADRERSGLPPFGENSWRAGLDRLLLGYAMPGEGDRLFQGILPYDLEGDGPRLLGQFLAFAETLFAAADRLRKPRSPGQWGEELGRIMAEFIVQDEETAREASALGKLQERLLQNRELAGFDAPVTLELFRYWLGQQLEKAEPGMGFITGGVTFCAMLPMRSIPFRVIALIGMNEGAFPRQNRPPGFDLIARERRRGDRSLRDEDRYLFLEAILSAREHLYLSYVGQSIRDGSEIPPSVLLSELLDYLDSGYRVDDREPSTVLVRHQRLQPFSPAYFDGSAGLFSFSAENLAAIRAREQGGAVGGEFLTTPLVLPENDGWEVSLAGLLRFYDNPARYFLVDRLGIRLEQAADPLEEREPFAVEGLDAYAIRTRLLDLALADIPPREALPVIRAEGLLPPARHGDILFAALAAEVEEFGKEMRAHMAGCPSLEPLDFSLEIGRYRLSGRLDRIWPGRLIRGRCARLKARDRVRGWIEHLVLNAVAAYGYPCESVLCMLDGTECFSPVANAAALLAVLLDRYREGLCQPLRFYPESSLAYANRQEWNLGRARQRWEGSEYVIGEGRDPYFDLCFGKTDPFTAEFDRLARDILGPLVAHGSKT